MMEAGTILRPLPSGTYAFDLLNERVIGHISHDEIVVHLCRAKKMYFSYVLWRGMVVAVVSECCRPLSHALEQV